MRGFALAPHEGRHGERLPALGDAVAHGRDYAE
jgi:hypothetical protein